MKRRAVCIDNFGGSDKMKVAEIPALPVGEGEVQIRVHAAGLNPVDWKIREGYLKDYLPHRFPLVLGWEFAGEVTALGYSARRFRVGDRVWGLAKRPEVHHGTFAEIISLPECYVTRAPADFTYEECAAVPLVGLTAYQGLFDIANLDNRHTVLVIGASGGVGHMAVQLAADKGAKVIGLTSAKHHHFVKTLGATHVLDYHDREWPRRAKELTEGEQGVDVVFDAHGGESLGRSLEACKRDAVVVSVAGSISDKAARGAGVRFHYEAVEPNVTELDQLGVLMEGRRIRPVVHKTWPLEKAAEALEELRKGGHVGKMVLSLVQQ